MKLIVMLLFSLVTLNAFSSTSLEKKFRFPASSEIGKSAKIVGTLYANLDKENPNECPIVLRDAAEPAGSDSPDYEYCARFGFADNSLQMIIVRSFETSKMPVILEGQYEKRDSKTEAIRFRIDSLKMK